MEPRRPARASREQARSHVERARLVRDPRPGVPTPLRIGPGTYAVHTQPGLESIALQEIATRYAAATQDPSAELSSNAGRRASVRNLGQRLVPGRAGIGLFATADPAPLRRVRTAEDLFAVVGYRRELGLERSTLDRIRVVARDAPFVEAALSVRVRIRPGARSGARLKFRVVARMAGAHEFRRAELQRAVERGIGERIDHHWRLVEEDADVEFWATLIDDELILGVRLSDENLRQRDYKVAHIPGSLRESVAAALGVLARPTPDDIVLDPFCGAGTILIERAHLERYRLLLGGDTDRTALEAARVNIGPRYKPIELHPWDAANLPLPDRRVSRVITNLPWGIKHGSHPENRRLYPRVLSEVARVLQSDGIAVLLTGERRLMSDVLRRGPLRVERTLPVTILGARAAIYICARADH